MQKLLKVLEIVGVKIGTVIPELEAKVLEKSNFSYNDRSPTRFEILEEAEEADTTFKAACRALRSHVPNMPGIFKGMKKSMENAVDVSNSEYETKRTEITESELEELEKLLLEELDICSVGYTKLQEHFIFENHGVLFDNMIVLTMKMDNERIDLAPSAITGGAVMGCYKELGYQVNTIVEYLAELGFACHGAHPLNGSVLSPPLAAHACLGWQGKHGIIITPENGPCIRLAGVFTSIENLPFTTIEENPHSWVEEFCETCGNCAKNCPSQAINNEKEYYDEELRKCIDNKKCFPYFFEYVGCSVCIKECMFHKLSYEKVKKMHDKRKKRKRAKK